MELGKNPNKKVAIRANKTYEGFTFNLYELASTTMPVEWGNQGFCFIFDFQGANTEKVELNKTLFGAQRMYAE